jgi:hypothetical protein
LGGGQAMPLRWTTHGLARKRHIVRDTVQRILKGGAGCWKSSPTPN